MPPESLGEFEHFLLLAVVHLGDDAYGVSIRKEIDRRLGREVAIGALYTSLDRLEKKGLVRSRMSDPTPARGGRSRRYVHLTAAGALALKDARSRLDRMWRGLAPDLTKGRS